MLEVLVRFLVKDGYEFIEVDGKQLLLMDFLDQMKDQSDIYTLDVDRVSRRLVIIDMQDTIVGYLVKPY